MKQRLPIYRMTTKFTTSDLKKLWRPRAESSGEDNGQVTIIGGSSLFHGAPMLSIKAASRLVDMVFFASQEKHLEQVAKLNSFIWIPWEELESYVAKSDAILIGPGLMRYHKNISDDVLDEAGTETKMLTKYLLHKFAHKKWVIDGGSLQVMNPNWIPPRAIVTPNAKEFKILFGGMKPAAAALKYKCVVISKGPTSYVTNGKTTYEISGGNAGLTKGGTGDVLAGIVAGLLAKNDALLAAAAGSFIIKKAAESLAKTVGTNFNADDVSENVFKIWKSLVDK